MAARAQRAQVEVTLNKRVYLAHQRRPVPPSVELRQGRNRLDVAGPDGHSGDVERPLDDRGVSHDRCAHLRYEMRPAKRVLPVVLRECAILIFRECCPEQGSDCFDLLRR